MDQASKLLDQLPRLRVLVCGDYMIDEYLIGKAERISPEAPVPVVLVEDEHRVLGGAGNVVSNLRSLGCAVDAVGVVGHDALGDQARELLERVDASGAGLITDPSRPTTQKVRLVAHDHQMIRFDRERLGPLAPDVEAKLFAAIDRAWAGCDAVLLSDYGKGALTPGLIRHVVQKAFETHKPLVGDPKGTLYEKYRGMAALTPNENEAFLAAGITSQAEAELVPLGRKLLADLELEALYITRGKKGVLLVLPETTHVIAAEPVEVYDVTGAGDTFVATLTACRAAGAGYFDSAVIANKAAGIAVAKVGTATVSLGELHRALHGGLRLYSAKEISEVSERLRKEGRTVVFTNGCFDLLHVGHVKYLERARALGDVLVLGLNSDESVKRLKGPTRPLINESDRAHILGSLQCVDYVVIFDEDTPLELIRKVRPQILAKGSDYTRAEVVGRDVVEGYGGQVRLIDFVDGHSTSELIAAIRGDRRTDG